MALFRRKGKAEAADDLVIDLREPAHAPGELVWGMPTRCPECGGFGYLDTVDVARGVMHQHCPSCWARWQTTEAETEPQRHNTSR